jgi:hypothetical protein
MSVVDAVAANVGPGEPMSLHVVLSDPSIFLDSAHLFNLLQDDGKEMTCEWIVQYLEPVKGKEPKKKYKTIAHGGYYYQELYSLAGKVLALLETKQQEYFPSLPALKKKFKYFSVN